MSDKPIVLVIRDPDYADDIELYGVEATVIYVDLGSAFDGPKGFRAMDPVDRQEWVEGTLYEVAELSEDHPARQRVEQLIADMTEGGR